MLLAAFAAQGQPAGTVRAGLPLGHLFWGDDPATGKPWDDSALADSLARGDNPELAAVLRDAEAWAAGDNTFPVVSRIEIEGRLPSDAGFAQSVAAARTAKWLVPLALCARVGRLDLRQICGRRANEGVSAWVGTYTPTGNPIDESNLLPVLLAVDLLSPTWDAAKREPSGRWIRSLLDASDAARRKELGSRYATPQDNWESWRLMLALVAASVLHDTGEVEALTRQWHSHCAANLDGDGRTWDFRRRGSLHYQVYDLEPMVWLRLLVPGAFLPEDDLRLRAAIEFLLPYAAGQRSYVEFQLPDVALAPPVAFDKIRAEAGMPEFQQKPWDPAEAGPLLYRAALVYPQVSGWPAVGRERISILDRTMAGLRGVAATARVAAP